MDIRLLTVLTLLKTISSGLNEIAAKREATLIRKDLNNLKQAVDACISLITKMK